MESLLSGDGASQDRVTISCVLCPPQPLGTKTPEMMFCGSKAGLILNSRLRSDECLGRPAVTRSRTPEPCLQQHVQNLLTKAFAAGVAPIIELGLRAAFHNANLDGSKKDALHEYVYEDVECNAYADLSSCRVWAYSVNRSVKLLPCFDIQEEDEEMICTMNPVLSAVLWRLLPIWEDKGPVLEVLFLATSPGMREHGWAEELETELESAALSLGCSAIAVAAVPVQGMSFWTERCGFEIVVPLKSSTTGAEEYHDAKDKDIQPLGEPVNELGQFLLQHMLLFTDTPLVAKVLSGESQATGDYRMRGY